MKNSSNAKSQKQVALFGKKINDFYYEEPLRNFKAETEKQMLKKPCI